MCKDYVRTKLKTSKVITSCISDLLAYIPSKKLDCVGSGVLGAAHRSSVRRKAAVLARGDIAKGQCILSKRILLNSLSVHSFSTPP
jgi:hypothetical protein